MSISLPAAPTIVAILVLTSNGGVLASDSDGKTLYADFSCGDCHGADAKTVKTPNIPKLAGMNVEDIYLKTKRFVESKVHDDVLKGCGESPNHVQIKRIADYVATLPR